ncbi:MAG: hypothetical protein UR26_C0005G0001 [candidate division TM6 bacterium GW2011_GWF2_32_72]|nr:MAG: hypothetical protein UR26_C0005G0001 [candidate division TM6 bacterium GW2011_GWF2_32_72]
MKHLCKVLSIALLCGAIANATDSSNIGYSFFKIRSQANNTAKRLCGWQKCINRFDKKEDKKFYTTFNLSAEYAESTHSKKIANYLFNTNSIEFVGSRHDDFKDNNSQVMAENFGLSEYFKANLEIKPKVVNWTFDLSWYLGLDKIAKGLYFKAYAPFVHTNWDLNFIEHCNSTGNTTFPVGYMGRNSGTLTDGEPAAVDSTVGSITEAFRGVTKFGDMIKCWEFGKVDGPQTKDRLAEIRPEFGWNFFLREHSHFGIAITGAIPTGNKPHAHYLFEPIVGNGGHFELGGAFSGHARIWKMNGGEQSLSVYIDGNINHLFNKTQTRSLGLTTTCGSNGCTGSTCCSVLNGLDRYMLLKKFDYASDIVSTENIADVNSDSTTGYKYTGELVNAINVVTRKNNVKVKINAVADISAKLCYSCKHFDVDLGYNFYGRTAEKITNKYKNLCDSYGVKGDEGVAIKIYDDADPKSFLGTSRLDSTASNALIGCKGTLDSPSNYNYEYINSNKDPKDSSGTAFSVGEDTYWAIWENTNATVTNIVDGIGVDTSYPNQQILSNCNLNEKVAASPSAITHKLFISTNYHFEDTAQEPYIGSGFEWEWDQYGSTGKKQNSLGQWGIWVKAGMNF